MSESQYPGNSDRSRMQLGADKPAQRPELKKIVSENVGHKKKTTWEKAKDVLWGPKARTAAAGVVGAVLVPMAIDMFREGMNSYFDSLVSGGDSRARYRSTRVGPITNYSAISSGRGGPSSSRYDRRELDDRKRAVHNFDDIVVGSRAEADMVLRTLDEIVRDYGHATVKDLLDLVGVTASFTDERYGWYDLREAGLSRYGDGYVFNMPKTSVIE